MSAMPKARVLLVDDEPQVLVALEDLLKDDFVVFKAPDAQRALDVLSRELDIAVIVTDQRMPKMSGDQFLARLRDSSDALGILLTGYADLSAVVRAVNDGRLFAYVTKPWDPQDLRLRIYKAAQHHRLVRRLAHERDVLHEQTSVLNAVLDSVADGVVVSDSKGEFVLLNQQAERMLAVRPNEARLADWMAASGVYRADGETPLAPSEDPFVRGMSQRTEMEVIVRNANTPGATVALTATPFRRDGRLAGSVALLHDVTERRLLEEQLARAQRLEAIGQLAGGVAHDFNNLLTIIQGSAEFVLRDLPPGDPKRAELDQLIEMTRRAAALTRQLLAIGRRDAIQPKVLDLNTVVSNMEGMLRRAIGSGIELVIQKGIPLGKVRADENQMEQIILNLALNARDAMSGSGTLAIETVDVPADETPRRGVLGLPRENFVALSVVDTGTGMDGDTQKRLFEPFFTTKGPGKGTGLGLSTVYGIVRRSGGHMGVESEIGRGSRFDVFLPRDDAVT